MKDLWTNELYRQDLAHVAGQALAWEKLSGKSVVISGATGMLGKLLVDTLLYKNERDGLDCTVYAFGRSEQKARERFQSHIGRKDLCFVRCDVSAGEIPAVAAADYILHLASSTHPLAYATDPIGTVTANVIGTNNLLTLAAERKNARFLFASTVEVYGDNRGDKERFDEAYCGYIDCNTMRAGYPESKRCGEALCQAYISQKGLDVVIPRLPRTFGPTMQMSDSKAIAQFIKKAIAGEYIVLKSAGAQHYTFGYAADVVCGMFYCLLRGSCGEAYNIADASGDITLRELAEHIASCAGTKVVFEQPDATEAAGYSRAAKALLDGEKLRGLGWKAKYSVRSGISRTLEMLEEK